MKIDDYSYFINREVNRPCVLVGSGPSMGDFDYKRFEGVVVSVGDAIIRGASLFKADYWVSANSWFPIPEARGGYDLRIINEFSGTTFIYADSVAYSDLWENDESKLNDLLHVDWFCYDQRHHGGKLCSPPRRCCGLASMRHGRKTIQEVVSELYGVTKKYSNGSTVAIHGLAFAMIMGCNPIYIQGIDIPSSIQPYPYYPSSRADEIMRYVENSIFRESFRSGRSPYHKYLFHRMFPSYTKRSQLLYQFLKRSTRSFLPDMSEIFSDFRYLSNIAAISGQDLYVLNESSSLHTLDIMKYLPSGDI